MLDEQGQPTAEAETLFAGIADLRERVIFERLDETSVEDLARRLVLELDRSKARSERADWYSFGMALTHLLLKEKLARLDAAEASAAQSVDRLSR